MIGRLRGVLVAKAESGVVIEVGGVGYEVNVTPRDLISLPGLGEEIVLHTHLAVREDNMALYGFDGRASRDMFRILLGASGVGPALGMAILSTLRPLDLRHAVATDDVAALVAAPGIGKRKAEKLILDLRPKLGSMVESSTSSSEVAKVREALESLGYLAAEVRAVLEEIPLTGSVEEMVRSALQLMGRNKGLPGA